jgi:predicted dehydrogenase
VTVRLLRAAVVGTGFIGPHHVEAIRRTGFGEAVAIVGSDANRAAACAERLRVPWATTDLEEVLADSSIDIVHVCSRNRTHEEITLAALAAGKHVLVEKPMALDPDGAARMAALAAAKGLVLGVAFTYRGYPMVRRARSLVRAGAIGAIRLVQGGYLQDWLSEPTDYNWRVDSGEAGRSRAMADIGSHWFDLMEFVTNERVVEVFAETRTAILARRRPLGDVATYEAASGPTTELAIDTEDEAIIVMRLAGGGMASCVLTQVSPGRKNHLTLEIAGADATLAWNLEDSADRLWLGKRDRAEILYRSAADAARILGPDPAPAGVAEGWTGALRDLLAPFYAAIVDGRAADGASADAAYPDAQAGLRAIAFVDAALTSASSGRWAAVGATQ